jgi:ABC-type branched-subunit amino acid transport system substrate-binding protein
MHSKAANMPIISSTSTSTSLREYENFFRTVSSDEEMSKELEKCLNEANVKNILLYYDSSDDYSNSWQMSITQILPSRVKTIDFHADDINASLENHHRGHGYDLAVIVPARDSINDALRIIEWNANRNDSERISLIGTDILYEQQFLINAQTSADGMVLVVPWFLNESSDYGRRARDKWSAGGDTISWRQATSYEATTAFVKALQSLQVERPQQARSSLKDNLQDIDLGRNDVAGIPLSFADNGERQGYLDTPLAYFVEVVPKDGASVSNSETLSIGVASINAQSKFTDLETCDGLAE